MRIPQTIHRIPQRIPVLKPSLQAYSSKRNVPEAVRVGALGRLVGDRGGSNVFEAGWYP